VTPSPVNRAFVVRRRVPLAQAVAGDDGVLRRLCAEPGVLAAEADRGDIRLIYDASRVGFERLQAVLREEGYALAPGWRHRLRAAWYRYLDDNTRSNAAAPASCCSNPTEVYVKRRNRR
jgi:hypothetical protein